MTSPFGLSITRASISPSRMARSVSSASSSRRCNSATSSLTAGTLSARFSIFSLTCSGSAAHFIPIVLSLVQVQSHQNFLSVGQITDKLSERSRQLFHQRRHSNDLLFTRSSRVLVDVDYFQIIFVRKMLFADFRQIMNSGQRSGRRTGDV